MTDQINDPRASLDDIGWVQDLHLTIVRDDGFKLIHCSESGWDIEAPNGQLFAWGATMDIVGMKIDREKRERLWY